ncbi:MAG TPA: hypothetical protein VFO70_02800 [Chitinophagaceae bacterium]|nr:hypothetical protein [Chitinophagaceae bacterium]
MRKYSLYIFIGVLLTSCWKNRWNDRWSDSSQPQTKVWGYKPVYGPESSAKHILYQPNPQHSTSTGNIYAFGNYVFQVEPGLGIHVIDNNFPANANRIRFITVKGCSQLSIKNNKLYTNSYDDLVVLEFSDLQTVREYSRLKGVFTEYRYGSPLAQPPVAGPYECPSSSEFVVGWVQDSIYGHCHKF